MSAAEQPLKVTSYTFSWQRILPCLIVFAAAFLFFGLLWPAMSPGMRASISVDFCLPDTASELSEHELGLLKSVIAQQASNQLTGQEFDSLIQQTQRTGKVVSASIEYFDRETIAKNISLGFAMNSGNGRLQMDYVCQGNSDQVRFLQLFGHRLANSIEDLALSPQNQVVVSNHLNNEKFDRAIWLANQIQSDLDQIRHDHNRVANQTTTLQDRQNRYSFASMAHASTEESLSQQRPISADALNSIDANSLSGLLTEIKSEVATGGDDTTFSVLKVDPVMVWAIGATPDRWAMVGLLAMAGMVSGFFALYQFVPAKPTTNVRTLSQSLGIPVVAVLPTGNKSQPKLASVEFLATLASTLFLFAKIFLIAFTVVVIGFAMIDSSIRESFFQNPFDGVAKIFRVFFGYA